MSGGFDLSFQSVSTGMFWKGCPVAYRHLLSTLLSRKQAFETALNTFGALEDTPCYTGW